MPQPLNVKNLEGIAEVLKEINSLFAMGQKGAVFLEWPEKFPVVADDGYSLGNIIFDDEEWTFESHE